MSSTTLLGARVNSSGQIIFSEAPKERDAFLAAFRDEPAGQELETHIETKEDRVRIYTRIGEILEMMDKQAGTDVEVTLPTFCSIVRLLIDTRDPAIFPPEVAAAPDTRPRNTDGTFKSEFHVFADTHSMNEIRARANSDRAFGDWFRGQVQAQIITPGVFKIAGAPPERSTTLADRTTLGSFARAYSATSIDAIRRPIGGYITLVDGSRFTVAEFNQLVTECGRVGLI